MDEFGQAHGGERRVLVPGHTHDSLDQSFDSISPAFGGDNHAGVKDQSHAGGLRGSRWLLMVSSRSRPKSPSSVTVEQCARERRRDSESRRA